MSSGGKGGAGGGSYNYFGRVAAVVGVGPLTAVRAVLADGKAIYEGTKTPTAGVFDLTADIDATRFAPDGYLKILAGGDTQTMPAEFTRLPHYRGLAVLLAHRFLFGKEKTTVPNIEIVAERLPVAPSALVHADHNVLIDGQCNPAAFLAEVFTSAFGAFRFATGRFVADDWLEAAEWCFEHQARCFCSPFFNAQADARKVAAELLAMFDGALYFDTQGRLGLRLLKPGATPGSLPRLDLTKWAEGGAPKQEAPGWSEVPARIDVEFHDRDRKYKRAPEPAKNLVASRVLGLEDARTVSMLHVTRRTQAADWGNELVRRSLKPAGSVKLAIRRAHARALGLEPGLKVEVDVDPEPGGDGLSQICVIEEIRGESTGPVNLVVRPDTLATAVPYAPDYDTEPGEDPDVESIVHSRLIPLPPQQFSEAALSFAVLATRPQPDIVGMRVFFDADDDGPYADLGTQTGFAARCELENSVVTAGPLVPGDEYEILSATADTDFTPAGAASNTAGVTFTADADPVAWGTAGRLRHVPSDTEITAGELVEGDDYEILSVEGGADFTAAGAASNTVGVTFAAGPLAVVWGAAGALLHLGRAGATTGRIRLRLADGADGHDSYLAAITPGSEIAAAEDPLLLVLANVDEDGLVILDDAGYPELEFCSVVRRACVEEDEPDLHEYAVLRARRGLPVRSWTDACEAWIVPRANIRAWTHSALPLLLADDDPAYVKLAAYRADREDEHALPQRRCKFPRYYDRAPRIEWISPAGSSATTSGADLDVEFKVTDAQGDIVSLRVESVRNDGEHHVVHHDRRFEPAAEVEYEAALTFAEGTHRLTVTAQDRLGHVLSQTRQVVRGTGILASHVAFSQPPGTVFHAWQAAYGPLFYFTVASPATGMELYQTTIGAPAPASGNPFNSLSIGAVLHPPFRMWARAKTSTEFGPWVCADYFVQ